MGVEDEPTGSASSNRERPQADLEAGSQHSTKAGSPTGQRPPDATSRNLIPGQRQPEPPDRGSCPRARSRRSPAAREPDDGALLRSHLAGDPYAFATLVRRHENWMWMTARSLLDNREDAIDAVQQAFIRAFRSAHTWRGDGHVAAWLHRIVARVVVDVYASRARTPIPIDTTEPGFHELVAPDHSDTAVAESVLQQVIAALPADQRECFVRTDLLGFTAAEVSAELGIPEGTVKSRRARGKARLIEALRSAEFIRSSRGTRAGP